LPLKTVTALNKPSDYVVVSWHIMDAAIFSRDEVEVMTLPEDGEAIVVQRLLVLLDLAISVGRREGLLHNTVKDNGEVKGNMKA